MIIRHTFNAIAAAICVMAVLPVTYAKGAPMSAEEIVARASKVGIRSKDSVAQVTVTFRSPNIKEYKIVYNMVWKSYHGAHGIDDKSMFFIEYPPQERGRAYMSWRYAPTSPKAVDMWEYIPQRRAVHKIEPRQTSGGAGAGFGRLPLDRQVLGAEKHRLIEVAHRSEGDYYVIESTPFKSPAYTRSLRWISTSNFTTSRVEYFDAEDQLIKQQHIAWKNINGTWLWQRVETINFENRTSSTMEISKMRVNIGLGDQAFSNSSLRLGFEHIL